MKEWILGVALLGVSGGGVAFVLAGRGHASHCGPCVEAKGVVAETDDACPSCKPTPPRDPADVTSLSDLLSASADTSRPRLSFEEPPFAPPAPRELAPLPHVAAAAGSEVCPMPRAVAAVERAPMPHMPHAAE